MKTVVYSKSKSFERFLRDHLGDTAIEFRAELQPPDEDTELLYLLHISGMELDCNEWLLKHVSGESPCVAICADVPDIREMLECVRLGARAYCNSHMAVAHYQQMMRLLASGQSWFPPQMLDATFKLALQAAKAEQKSLDMLTRREREIALAVAEGNSNRQIAEQFEISEPTVKTHLTSIFKKLEIKDRVGLVLYLKQA
jgi:DNA-binding NarL/FixJ family response regulator